MGARTLRSRLIGRVVAVVAIAIAGVACAAVGQTYRVLDAGDTQAARAYAVSLGEALARERAEGDALDLAIAEVSADAPRTVRFAFVAGERVDGWKALAAIPAGECATIREGALYRGCATVHDGAAARVVAAVPIDEHRVVVTALAQAMLLVVVAAGIAAAAATARVLRSPLAEVAGLVAWTSRIVESEAREAPPAASTREIAHLGAAFDLLVARLLDAVARERASAAHIAHELRTPLTAMRAEIDALAAGESGENGRTVARLRADAAKLADVIDAILILSHRPAENGAAGGGAIVNVADVAREMAPPSTRVDAPDEVLVLGDERLLALAIRNLLDNARRHAGADARVVRIAGEGDRVRVSVVDDGPGLGEAERAQMFDRYWRGPRGDGYGLGLALVRAVAERHGGSSEARANEGGRGLDVSMLLGGVVRSPAARDDAR